VLTLLTISSRTTLDDDSRKWITHGKGSFLPFQNLDQDDFRAFHGMELFSRIVTWKLHLEIFYSVLAEEA